LNFFLTLKSPTHLFFHCSLFIVHPSEIVSENPSADEFSAFCPKGCLFSATAPS